MEQLSILEVKNVVKEFDHREVLRGLSLSVEQGEVVVIIGPSGCGKSTLLRTLNGLEDIQGGEILLDGEDIHGNNMKLSKVRERVGMVFQSYELFPHLNVMGNLLLGPVKAQGRKPKEVEAEAIEWLERVQLSEKKEAFPRELSGGQKQRVAIVRALLMEPEILLFDEVTAALDPEMVKEVLVVISELAREGRTMIMVTHQMDFARVIADRIVFMDKGNIVEISDPETFFTQPKSERAQEFLKGFDYSDL
ncbi:MAG: amino acid ABC transporter ATP-binding protein [Tissierellia bacterium]|nr:amino acid ABC transporter ATP-binding protein [Tissierellia bacterium]